MKICSRCGSDMSLDAFYCKKCGAGAERPFSHELDAKKDRPSGDGRSWFWPAMYIGAAIFIGAAAWILFATLEGSAGRSMSAAGLVHTAGQRRPEHIPLRAEKGEIRIPVSSLPVFGARFYSYTAADRVIKFFLLRSPDAGIRSAFDACSACYRAKLGYIYEDGFMVCNNCGMTFRPGDIGLAAGGCNPIPLPNFVSGKTVVIKASDLMKGACYF